MTLFPTIPAPLTRFILGQLHDALPPPPDPAPETLEARNQVALAAVVRLTPMNTAEALLAVHAIASEAHATAALREAVLFRDDMRVVGQCRAQSAMMIRQAMQVRKELRTVQEARRSAEFEHQQRIEAAEREAEETMRRVDETAPAPFLRRLAQRRLDGTKRGSSHELGNYTNNLSMRLDSGSKAASAHTMSLDRSKEPHRRGQGWPAVA